MIQYVGLIGGVMLWAVIATNGLSPASTPPFGENSAAAQDTDTEQWDRVQFRTSPAEGVRTLNGKVIDLQPRHLELELPSGSTRRIARAEIVSVQLLHYRPVAKANQAAADGDFAQAIKDFDAIMGQTVPLWLQRYAAIRRVQCLRAVQQYRNALAGFVILANHDPNQVPVEAVPVAWGAFQVDQLLENDLKRSLGSENRWERLVAASWGLLHPPTSAACRQVMTALAQEAGSDAGTTGLRSLATAQLWRIPSNLTAAQLDARQQELEQFPSEVKAGPLLLMGKIRKNAGQVPEATDLFIRVATVYPEQHDLVLLALEAAYLALRELDPTEANEVGQWLLSQFPNSPQADEIRSQVRR